MVKVGYIFNGTHFRGEKGILQQGSIVSSIFINIYLNELDILINRYKLSFDSGINKNINKVILNSKINVKKQKKLNIISTNKIDNELKRLFYIRYAAEFIIGLDCDMMTAKIILENITNFICDILKLDLKYKHIMNFRHNRTFFLGFIIKGFAFNKRPICTNTNKQGAEFRVTSRPSILFPMKIILDRLVEKGFIRKSKYGMKSTSLRRLIHYSLYNIIEYYNSIYRGFAYYYKICTFHSLLRRLHYILKISCILTIALKMKLKTIHKVIKRYGMDLNIIENNVSISFVK
jgi:hypothetical protein